MNVTRCLRRPDHNSRFSRTLYESKGLEFDDVNDVSCLHRAVIPIISYQVLLYKFFEDSSSDLSQWRIVLNMINEEDGVVVSAPTFDNSRHAGVCTEVSRRPIFFDPNSQCSLRS